MAEDLEQLLAEGSDIAVIGYHFNDSYENIYSNARIEYYGVVGYPHVVIDGSQTFDVSYDAMLVRYNLRIAIQSSYSIDIDVDRNGTLVNATVNVGQLGTPNPENIVLHFVLTESHIPESWYGVDEVNHVERLMIPDGYGTPIESSKNVLSTFEFEFEMDTSWLVQNCELVAFLQDTVTKDIKQAQVFDLESTLLYNDVALTDILNPNDGYCAENISPVIRLENYGYDILNNCMIAYQVNNETNEYYWEGSLSTYQSEIVTLPEISFILEDENSILVELSLPNGQEDENPDNNSIENSFDLSQIIDDQNLILELKTDYFGSETSWELLNSLGEIVYSGDGYEDSTMYNIDLQLLANDCYTFIMYDTGGDGICCENGFGYYRIKNADGLIYFVGGNFGELDISSFQIDVETNIISLNSNEGINIFPNPGAEFVEIKSETKIARVVILDLKGQLIFENEHVDSEYIHLDLSNFRSGVYFIRVETDRGLFVKKLMKM